MCRVEILNSYIIKRQPLLEVSLKQGIHGFIADMGHEGRAGNNSRKHNGEWPWPYDRGRHNRTLKKFVDDTAKPPDIYAQLPGIDLKSYIL